MSTSNTPFLRIAVIVLATFLISVVTQAQNLVVDPGFELWNGTLGSNPNTLGALFNWDEANGTPDHHHVLNNGSNLNNLDTTCATGAGQNQCGFPHGGQATLGLYKANGAAGTKEWAVNQLSSPLVPGQAYRVGYWIQNKKDNPTYIMETSQWGMYFGNTVIPPFDPDIYFFGGTPNEWVTCTQMIAGSQWQYLEWCFVPTQSYSHIYIGYVGDPLNATVNAWSGAASIGYYVWVDDVVVEAINLTLAVIPDMTICTGDSVELWASSGLSISWDGGLTTDSTIWVSPTTTTTYYVETIAQGGCQLVDSVTVAVINCNCTIILQNSIAGVADSGCPGATCNGTALVTPVNGAAPYTFTWNDPSGQTTASAISLCAGTYDCYVMDIDGCMDTVSVTLTGPQFPTLAIAVTDETCQGVADGSVDLSVNGGTGPFSYLWSNAAVTEDLSGVGGGSYSVEVTDGIGCLHADTAVVAAGTPPLQANIAAVTPYCDSDAPDVLTAAPAGGAWSGTGVDPSTGVFDPAIGPGSYTVYYMLPQTCSNPDSAVVVVEATPVAAFTASPTSGCAPLAVAFEPVGLPAGHQCAWILGDGSTSAQSSNFSYTYIQAGTFDVTLTVTSPAGCTDAVTENDLISVSPLPVVQFEVAFPTGPFVEQSVLFNDVTQTPSQAWDWEFGDGDGAQGPTAEHTYNEAGSYNVTLTVITDSGCVSMATEVIEIAAETQVFMPNAFSPDGDGTNEVLRAELQGIAPDHFELMIFDRWGLTLFSTKDGLASWDGTFNNGGVQVPSGVYVWKLTARSAYSGERLERSGHVMLLR